MSGLGSRIRHVRCANPGPMTLTGTNTYVVGGHGRVAIIDPGPDLDARDTPVQARSHLDDVLFAVAELAPTMSQAALIGHDPSLGAAAGPVDVDVLLTHHHRDHAGGVDALLARLVAHGHRVRVFGGGHCAPWPADGRVGDLAVLPAPGHTADSMAFALRDGERGVLFSGDTILGGSSSFVAHPDGNLTAYLETLDSLAEFVAGQPTVLAPGHGSVGADAALVIDEYRVHREQRLNQVRDALGNLGRSAPVAEVADAVYPDVDLALRPAVEATVSAQVEHLLRTDPLTG